MSDRGRPPGAARSDRDSPQRAMRRTGATPSQRALDAIHLATALSMGDDREAFIVYEARLGRAAAKQRLEVAHPGATRLS